MTIANKFLDRMFRKIDGLVWDVTTGQLGIKDSNGIYTLTIEGEGDEAVFSTTVNPFDAMGLSVPAFATNTPIDQVEIADIIVGESQVLGWVVETRERSLKLLDKNGMTKNYTPPKVAIMGTNGVLVVKNLFSLVGGSQGLAGVQNNLLPLLALGGDINFDRIMPLILMQSLNGAAPASGNTNANAGFANMLPFLMLSKGGKGGLGDIDPMMLMAMSGGGAGMNPMMLLALASGSDEGRTSAPSLPPLTRVTRA